MTRSMLAGLTRRVAAGMPMYGRGTLLRLLPAMPREPRPFRAGGVVYSSVCWEAYDTVSRALFWLGSFDPWVGAVCRAFAGPGDTVIDVGANLGAVSLPMARHVGPGGRVWSYEPAAGNIERLERNLRSSGMTNVTVVPNAVSTAASIELELPSHGEPGHYRAVRSGGGGAGRVAAVTLDGACERAGGVVALCKIDVEGGELDVLESGRASLASRRVGAVVFECHDELAGGHPVVDLFRGAGYEVFRVCKRAYSAGLCRLGERPRRGRATHDFVAVARGSGAERVAEAML